MPWCVRIALGLAVCSACAPAAAGREPPAAPKAVVEFRWVEDRRIEGVTEDKGFQSSCDPKSIVYMHKKPALVLTAADVTEAPLSTHDFRGSGSGVVAAPPPIDPCTLLTQAEIEHVIGPLRGKPKADKEGPAARCIYAFANGTDALEVWVFPAEGIDRGRKQAKQPVAVEGADHVHVICHDAL